MATRSSADIANTAVRIFLQQFGRVYDEMRGYPPYAKSKHFFEVRDFFDDRCCYCGVAFDENQKAVEDHLVGHNRKSLGLHAWGNIVPACDPCNSAKQGRPWRDFIAETAGIETADRYKRINEYIAEYDYDPPFDLDSAAKDLSAESGAIAMALIDTKITRTLEATRQK